MNKVTILHGFGDTPNDHWYKYLKNEIISLNLKISIVDFPDSENPILDSWTNRLKSEFNEQFQKNVVVAHSLGTITLLDYLSKENEYFDAIVLVSPFNRKIDGFSALDEYIEATTFNAEKIKKNVGQIVIIYADNDNIVPSYLSEIVANDLNVTAKPIRHDGHFLGRDGYKEFPLVSQITKNLLQSI